MIFITKRIYFFREVKGRCITNLKIVNIGDEVNGIYEHCFEKVNDLNNNFYSNGITEGNYVLISTDKRTAVAAGFVSTLTPKTISVFLERYSIFNSFQN